MALVVSTSPPELVVKTKVKKVPAQRNETPFLCDRFWACILDDYLDDDSDGGILEVQERDDQVPQSRSIQKSKKSRNKRSKDVKRHHPKESPRRSSIGDLDTLLSDDHEIDQRENGMMDSSRQYDVLETVKEEAIAESEQEDEIEKETNREKKLKKRVQSAPAEIEMVSNFQQSQPPSQHLVPEADEFDPATELGTKSSEVFHYAPLPYMKKTSLDGKVGRSPSKGTGDWPGDSSPPDGGQRVPVDPEEDRQLPSRHMRHRNTTGSLRPTRSVDAANSMSSNLPRSPSGTRGYSYHTRSSMSTHERPKTVERRKERKVERIDLTNEPHHESLIHRTSSERRRFIKAEANDNLSKREESMNWTTQESQKAESDYRRRKLDRKEALNRIRAIKARLQSSDL